MSGGAPLPRLLLHERVIILLAVTAVTALSWLYLLQLARAMPDMAGMAMAMAPRWTPAVFALSLAMWAVMMAGMMLPGAAPMILTFAALHRRQAQARQRSLPTLLFAAGYLLTWGGFSLVATLLQWTLDRQALLSPMLATSSARLGGALFLLAGLYQLTPLKQACLSRCRSPFAFLFNRWRDGANGALRMGIEHGAYCLGCCWLLMALLFALGAMNLLWVAAIALLVFAEKLLRGGAWIAGLGGVAMIGYGLWLVVQA
jgi:predicted metal-binding membrane protein